jgi:hypothetical protein
MTLLKTIKCIFRFSICQGREEYEYVYVSVVGGVLGKEENDW